jgi:hypothetical protein
MSMNQKVFPHTKRMVMRSFRGDCREAYVISNSYGMGDPLASRFREAGRTVEGGRLTRRFLAGITRRIIPAGVTGRIIPAGVTRP